MGPQPVSMGDPITVLELNVTVSPCHSLEQVSVP